MSYGVKFRSLALAAALGFGLAACSGSSGGGTAATPASTTTTSTTVTTTGGAVSGTAVNTSATAVAGTGTAGTATTTTLSMADKISVVSSSSAKPTRAPKGISVTSSSLWARLIPTTWAGPTSATPADWYVDPQFIYVHERSEEAFQKSNEILCMIGQTEWESMTNQGAYLALIDNNKCSTNRDSASSAGQSSASTNTASNANAPNYQQWTVMSKLADPTAADPAPPQVISAWVPGEVGGGPNFPGRPGIIYAKVIVAEKPSTANPYGFFYMSFEAHPYQADGVTVDTATTMMSGYMRTVKLASGEVVLQFYNGNTATFDPAMIMGSGTATTATVPAPKSRRAAARAAAMVGPRATISLVMEEKSTLSKSATGGGGEVSFPDEKNMITAITTAITNSATSVTVPLKQMRFAHDGTSFQRQDVDPATGNALAGTSPVCLDTTVKESTAWRYAAYRAADGSRITLNTGFPIIYTDATGDHEGWIGNWGLWLNDGTAVASGATINKYDYATQAKTPYTYKTTGGKLTKHTKVTLSLTDIKNIPLQIGINSGMTWNQYEVSWNGTAIVAKKVLDNATWMWTDLTASSTPVKLNDPITINQWDRSFNFWSQSLNGSGRVELSLCSQGDVTNAMSVPPAAGSYSNCTATGNVKGTLNSTTQEITPYITATNAVTFNKEQTVFMGDATNAPAGALACTENCPSGANIAAYNAGTAATSVPAITTVEYADSGWSAWPNLSSINQNLTPANWQHCPSMATDGTAGVVCTSAGQPDYNAPYCTGAAGEVMGGPYPAGGSYVGSTSCQGWDSITNTWKSVMMAGHPGGYYEYTFDVGTYTLYDKKAGPAVSTDLSTTAGQWVYSGLLFDPIQSGKTFGWTDWNGNSHTARPFTEAVQCDWPYDQGNGSWSWDPATQISTFSDLGNTAKYGTCTWKLWDTLDVYYTWQTGSDWNTLKLLTDANGKAVAFDEPFILDYIHGSTGTSNTVAIDNTGLGVTATTDPTWFGARMGLQYGGFGDIWGIPGKCVDMDTGLEKSCDMNSRWVPAFTIPDESAATYVDSTNTVQTVYIKALEKEERMVPLATCTATLAAYALPAATDYVAPGIGTEPTAATNPNDPIASGAPSVVGGVKQ